MALGKVTEKIQELDRLRNNQKYTTILRKGKISAIDTNLRLIKVKRPTVVLNINTQLLENFD